LKKIEQLAAYLVLNGLHHPALKLVDVADSLQMSQVFSVKVVPEFPALAHDLAASVKPDGQCCLSAGDLL